MPTLLDNVISAQVDKEMNGNWSVTLQAVYDSAPIQDLMRAGFLEVEGQTFYIASTSVSRSGEERTVQIEADHLFFWLDRVLICTEQSHITSGTMIDLLNEALSYQDLGFYASIESSAPEFNIHREYEFDGTDTVLETVKGILDMYGAEFLLDGYRVGIMPRGEYIDPGTTITLEYGVSNVDISRDLTMERASYSLSMVELKKLAEAQLPEGVSTDTFDIDVRYKVQLKDTELGIDREVPIQQYTYSLVEDDVPSKVTLGTYRAGITRLKATATINPVKTWKEGRTYSVGDIVEVGDEESGALYQASEDHTATADNKPPSGSWSTYDEDPEVYDVTKWYEADDYLNVEDEVDTPAGWEAEDSVDFGTIDSEDTMDDLAEQRLRHKRGVPETSYNDSRDYQADYGDSDTSRQERERSVIRWAEQVVRYIQERLGGGIRDVDSKLLNITPAQSIHLKRRKPLSRVCDTLVKVMQDEDLDAQAEAIHLFDPLAEIRRRRTTAIHSAQLTINRYIDATVGRGYTGTLVERINRAYRYLHGESGQVIGYPDDRAEALFDFETEQEMAPARGIVRRMNRRVGNVSQVYVEVGGGSGIIDMVNELYGSMHDVGYYVEDEAEELEQKKLPRLFVSKSDPDPVQGTDGDLWFQAIEEEGEE